MMTQLILEQHPTAQISTDGFGRKVKEMVAKLTGTTPEFNETREGKATFHVAFKRTLGQLQQTMTECMRQQFGDDVWLQALFLDPRLDTGSIDYLIIDDVRFENEVRHINDMGGWVVRLVTPTDILLDDGRDIHHSSEIALDNWSFDHVIHNPFNTQKLRQNVKQFLHGQHIIERNSE